MSESRSRASALRRSSPRFMLRRATLASVVVLSAGPVSAADFYWWPESSITNNDWLRRVTSFGFTVNTNWSFTPDTLNSNATDPLRLPGPSDTVRFKGSGNSSLNGSITINGITSEYWEASRGSSNRVRSATVDGNGLLNLGAGGINMAYSFFGSATRLQLNCRVALTQNLNLVMVPNAGSEVTFGSQVTAPSLTMTGGRLWITGTTLMGNSNVFSGSVVIGKDPLLIDFDEPSPLAKGGTTGSLSGDLYNSGTLIFNRSNDYTHVGNVFGSGTVVKLHGKTTTVTGDLAHTGGTTIEAGTLQVGDGGTSGSIAGNVTNKAAIRFNRSDDLTYSGGISGSGSLTKAGTGTLLLNSANSYTGGTIVNAGVLAVDGNQVGNRLPANSMVTVNNGGIFVIRGVNALATSNNAIDVTVNTGGVLRIASGASAATSAAIPSHAHLRNITLNDGASIVLRYSGSGTAFDDRSFDLINSLTSNGNASIFFDTGANAGNAGLNLNGPRTFNTVSGNLAVSAEVEGSGSLTKLGVGTLTLAGANTYTGDTVVTAGTLALANKARLKFVIGATSGANKRITGSGTVTLDGGFDIDTTLADASALTTGSWMIVDVATLTESFGPSFTILGAEWSKTSHVWTKTVGNKRYLFNQATGVLTLLPAASYASWISDFFPGVPDPAIIGTVADPDSDHVPNAVEMVLGGNPNTGVDSALLPTLERVNADPDGNTTFGDYLLFTYRRTDFSVTASVTADCETDTDLVAPWTLATGAPAVVILTDDNFAFVPPSPDTDRVRVYVPRGANATLFGRLKVVVP